MLVVCTLIYIWVRLVFSHNRREEDEKKTTRMAPTLD